MADYIDYFNSVAAEYESVYEKTESKVRELVLSSIIKFHLPKEETLVLDLCGKTGRWTAAIAALGHRVMLVEPSVKLLDIAKGRIESLNLHKKVIAINAEVDRLKFEDNTFDFAVALQGISYFEPKDFAKELFRVMRPNGTAIVSFAGRVGAGKKLFLEDKTKEAFTVLETSFLEEPIKTKFFTSGEASNLLEACGFSVVFELGVGVIAGDFELEDAEELKKLAGIETLLASNKKVLDSAPEIVLVVKK